MQEWIVGLIVASAFGVVVKRSMPKAMQRAARTWMAGVVTCLGWNSLAAYFVVADQEASRCSSGCGACGGCGSAEPPPVDGQFVIKLKELRREP